MAQASFSTDSRSHLLLNIKNPLRERVFSNNALDRLLDLGFLVHHVLAYNGIVFLDLHLFWHILFVFIRGVKVTGTSRGYQADFIS